MKLLSATDRYIARLIAVPLAGTLVVAAMLLILDKMLRLFDFVAAQGGPVSVVWRMLANMIPEYLSLGIPIGVMLGILLAFRRLALSSELDVLRGVGLSPTRLMKVPYIFTIAFALINLAIVGFIQPYSRYAYEGLQYELRSGALGASIKVGEFTNLGKGMTLRIEESRDRGRDLHGIFVRVDKMNSLAEGEGQVQNKIKDQSLAVTAARGTFMATDDPDVIILRLTDGVMVQRSDKIATPRILSFSSHDLPIDLPKIENFRGRGDADRELTLPELVRLSAAPGTDLAMRYEMRANFHFRMAEVAMMLLLPLAALAFAIPPKRSTSALGVFLSIVFIVTYHKVNQYAEDMGAAGRIDPIIALWVPFFAFGALICWMYYVVAYKPGGQPISALEAVFSKTTRWVVKGLQSVRKRLGHKI
ncbi:MAG: LPS export ABC transporter permease LptF [Sphingobium sp.]|nr:LPS export ABC transporter permease LptF [Sphingobium sp.]